MTMGLLGFSARLVKRLLARTSYRMLQRMPLPAEYKWRASEELFSAIIRRTFGAIQRDGAVSASTMAQVLEEAGTSWMANRAEFIRETPAAAQATAELLGIAFKTLDMVTQVRVSENVIRAVTWSCPFVDSAKAQGSPREVCWQLCGSHRSLFSGLAQGLPKVTAYEAPRKMGWGDTECEKEFAIGTTRPSGSQRQRTNTPLGFYPVES